MSHSQDLEEKRKYIIESLEKFNDCEKILYAQKISILQEKIYRLRYLNSQIKSTSPLVLDLFLDIKGKIKKFDIILISSWIVFVSLILFIENINIKIVLFSIFLSVIFGTIIGKSMLMMASSFISISRGHLEDEKEFMLSQFDYELQENFDFEEEYFIGKSNSEAISFYEIKICMIHKIRNPY